MTIHATRSLTINGSKPHPIPPCRTSIKMNRQSSLEDSKESCSSQNSISSKDSHYINLETPYIDDSDSKKSTKIGLNGDSNDRSLQTRMHNINLVINNHSENSLSNKSPKVDYEFEKLVKSCKDEGNSQEDLTSLMEEFKTSLNNEGCDNKNCQCFKILSYRLTQALVSKIDSLQINHDHDQQNRTKNDKATLVTLLIEREKQIQDLERSLENQKRLRLQDANQVEEKAAKIKEWVANKLKELENQNKQLREQNKKQKQTVDNLNMKLTNLNSLTSPRRVNLRRSEQQIEGSLTRKLSDLSIVHDKKKYDGDANSSNLSKQNIASLPPVIPRQQRSDSPVYDSVSIEHIKRRDQGANQEKDDVPPPRPQHRIDEWEHQLYNLAERNISNIFRRSNERKLSETEVSNSEANSDEFMKSSSNLKNDIISLMKPSLTTINGDQVVDDMELDEDESTKQSEGCIKRSEVDANDCLSRSLSVRNHKTCLDSSNQFMSPIRRIRKETHSGSCDDLGKEITSSLFNSPRRTRNGQGDSILRTQSVRRNPVPGKLYDFITADLVKRGHLIKPGALKSHNRWAVLRDFHLYLFKSESDETNKANPQMSLRLERTCQVCLTNQSGESSYPFKLVYPDKTIQLVAENAIIRDDWIRILTVAINMSDIDSTTLTKDGSSHEGLMSFTRHGNTRRCNGVLINNILFFLKSLSDPTPLGYIFLKGAKIKEITDNFDYDPEEQEIIGKKSCLDCSLAIYPRYSMTPDPIYITLGGQQDIDKWFYHLCMATGCDQSCGTTYEKALIKMMLTDVIKVNKNSIPGPNNGRCLWREYPILLYSDCPINQPLTSLPNETLKLEAIEMFKSIRLFTQVPLEPIAIDYHISLLQNCLSRLLKHPELRNEFYSQLIKQGTYVLHRCSDFGSSTSSSCTGSSSISSGCSPVNHRSSYSSIAPDCGECHIVSDTQVLDSLIERQRDLDQANSTNLPGDKSDVNRIPTPHSSSELIQIMQILAVSVSLHLPRGRVQWWLVDYLNRFADQERHIGKYALYILRAIDRALQNGTRDNIPSRTEIMSILLRNPYDHSNPHSLPLTFPDGSYMVIEADGSTTIEEFMSTMSRRINIRHSSESDFYLFADDPSGSSELHILEPQRKILDIVGWWEQTLRLHNSGRYQNTKVIKLICKKRLVLRVETNETYQERLMVVHQLNQEIVAQKIPLDSELSLELASILTQLTFGDFGRSDEPRLLQTRLENVSKLFLADSIKLDDRSKDHLLMRWKSLSGRSPQECVRVYLNCIRRLKLDEKTFA